MRLTHVRRPLVALALTATVVGGTATGVAAAHPPNPTDKQLARADQNVKDHAAQVGKIAAALSATNAKLSDAQQAAEIAIEHYHRAVDAWHHAQQRASAAETKAAAATRKVRAMSAQLDRFVADSYKNGGTAIPLTAMLTAKRPEDLIHDAGMLEIAGERQGETLRNLDRLRAEQTNALSLARAALQQQAAAKADADAAKRTATAKVAAVRAELGQLAAQRKRLQHELAAAQRRAGLLHQARRAAIERARRAAARRAAEARQAAEARRAAAAAAARARTNRAVPRAHAAAIAVNAALSQVGTPYVWGGSTPGVGFDCSGLTSWAYAQAGIYLDRFSGNQYNDGSHVPLSALRPGDLLFWSTNGRPSGIHHVAMYVGRGQIVEAPTFGIPVHVRAIWSDGQLLPYATRVA